MRFATDVVFRVLSVALLALSLLDGAGCDNDIDPDTLVRELRVLAIRTGDPSPGSEAGIEGMVDLSSGMPDIVFTQNSIQVSVLSFAPAGPGRRNPTPRPLRYEWWACVGPLSLYSPGNLDPDCSKFAPGDPPPAENSALVSLTPTPLSDPKLIIPSSQLKQIIGTFLQVLLGASGGMGGTGSITLPTHPITVLLPLLVRVSYVDGDLTNSLDNEVAFTYLNIAVALPGMTLPAPNHNPILPASGGVLTSSDETGPMQPLLPCPDSGPCVPFPVTRLDPTYFTGIAQAGSIETYTPLDDSGRTNVAETMRYTWYSTDGTFGDERTGDVHPTTQWINAESRPAPDLVGIVDMWLVLQDERNGVDYQHFQLQFP